MAYRKKTEFKPVIGALLWIAIIVSLTLFVRSRLQRDSVIDRLTGYFGKQTRTVELVSNDYQMLGFGDPIFLLTDENPLRVGNVSYIDFGEGYEEFRIGDTKEAMITLYGNAPTIAPGDYMKVHEADQSVEWVIRTMMTPNMREKISTLINEAWTENQEELVAMFQPLIEESITDATRIIQEDLQAAVENHREQIDDLSQRYQDQLLKKKIIPLIRNEIWPIVQNEAQPLAETIGKEIWAEVSVWRFGWRYIYDRSPLPEKNLTEKEFNRFVELKAVPILEGHYEDFIELQKSLLDRISGNEKVRNTFSKSVREVANDPNFRELVTSIFREVLVENPRLKESLKQKWQSPAAQRAMARANRRLDPTVRKIGATLFGSTRTAITPEFARVLRSKVLHKDKRWLTLHTKALGNRNEELAKQIMESDLVTPKSGIVRMPMFTEFQIEEYPIPAAPPIDNFVKRENKE